MITTNIDAKNFVYREGNILRHTSSCGYKVVVDLDTYTGLRPAMLEVIEDFQISRGNIDPNKSYIDMWKDLDFL